MRAGEDKACRVGQRAQQSGRYNAAADRWRTAGDTHLRRGQARHTQTLTLCVSSSLISSSPLLHCLPLPFSTYRQHFAKFAPSHPFAERQPKVSSLSSSNVGVKLVSQFNWRPRYAMQCISLGLLIPVHPEIFSAAFSSYLPCRYI